MTQPKETLLPCPCCKGLARSTFENGFELSVFYYVECTVCGLRTDSNTTYEYQAIAAWNNRSALSDQSDDVAELVAALAVCSENTYKIGGEVGNTIAEKEVKRLCREQY